MSAQLAAGAAIAAAACAAVYMNFASPNPAAAAAEEPKGGRLQKTLTNGGLMPQPGNKKLQSRPSGSMAVFTEGQPALGGAESGTAN
mmetsp:Transcript_13940/g.35991  ORF Transcript_13940/g.35991 Transcript_13940/m.35991 type:complete len:87 (-) Transcript_13940:264-524(-)|eukprot:CAMPEP_0115837900 /NCGR_PEP_ID=MMETSP0287-20121206/5455_1 /TAXON_ID=412157 /ORGANISM="Chrysochromulina rotalis, Strain UIO044" /LENGTH=86 /DNA_ID=CAMNT_0003291417 /DNA_START=113 /DNA_END=373 /DNA_ORIENTATION=-